MSVCHLLFSLLSPASYNIWISMITLKSMHITWTELNWTVWKHMLFGCLPGPNKACLVCKEIVTWHGIMKVIRIWLRYVLVHTHNHFTAQWILSRTTQVTGTRTNIHSLTSVVPYLLLPSKMIHGILHVQSTHLTVFFHNLCPSFLWSTSCPGTLHFILHTFLHLIIVFFSQHMPLPPSQPLLL